MPKYQNPQIEVKTNAEGIRLVSSRELYKFLELKGHYTDWIKRMFEYGFEENEDYFSSFSLHPRNKQPIVDYQLTTDTAKEISMIQRTAKGKQARKYFIDCEKKLLELVKEESCRRIPIDFQHFTKSEYAKIRGIDQTYRPNHHTDLVALSEIMRKEYIKRKSNEYHIDVLEQYFIKKSIFGNDYTDLKRYSASVSTSLARIKARLLGTNKNARITNIDQTHYTFLGYEVAHLQSLYAYLNIPYFLEV